MDVLRAVGRHPHLQHGGHVRVVHPACRHVGREHHKVGALAELLGHPRAVRLRLARVHLEDGVPADHGEELGEHPREARGVEEDEHLVAGLLRHLLEEREQLGGLRVDGRDGEPLRHVLVRRLVFCADGVHHARCLSSTRRDLCHLHDVAHQCGGEEQRLTCRTRRGESGEDLRDAWPEPHLKQLVCLVKDEHAKLIEQRHQIVVEEQIDEASRCGDEE
mmetsp:Transcript_8893/g.19697  ORF Transcript_8893/g.19697 Transcript_8893/m.19697 type:complete len:219 (-) Transcript_8893:183-839(-)